MTHSFGEFEIGAAGGAAAAGPRADDGAGLAGWAALGLSLAAGGAAFLVVALFGRRLGAARPTPAEG